VKSESKPAITQTDSEHIVVRNYELTGLIGRLDFGEMIY
jgi:hypothetical protein